MDPDDINKIVEIINPSPEFTNIRSSFQALLIELNLIDKHVNPMILEIINITFEKLSPEEAIKQILIVWRERCGASASIQNLVSAFENLGYVDIPTILLGHTLQIKQELLQRKRFPVPLKSETLIEGDTVNKKKLKSCRYDKNSTQCDTESVSLLESGECFGDHKLQASSGFKVFNRPNKSWCEFLSSKTRRSICKYVSIFILFQVCIALSLHAQLRTLTREIAVQTLDGGADNSLCPNITVSSYIEYQMKMNQLTGKLCSVNVFIDLKTRKDWQLGVPLKDPEKISQLKLRGDIPFNLLASILQESKQLNELIISNSHNGICDTDKSLNESFAHNVVNLKNLKSMTLENVTACSSIYQFISENAHFKYLESFQIKSGVINEQNVGFIHEILKSLSQRLKYLYFPNTKWNSLLFGNNVPVFSNVENIRLDFISDNNNSLSFMSTRFTEVLPNLKIFESRKGMLPWNFFQRLLKCRRLTKIIVTVTVPTHYSKPIKMNFLSQASSTLKQVEVSFHFPNKKYTDLCDFEGIENERVRFSLFLVKANCKIRHI